MGAADTNVAGLDVGGGSGGSKIIVIRASSQVSVLPGVVCGVIKEEGVTRIDAGIAHDCRNEDVATSANSDGGISVICNSGTHGLEGGLVSGTGVVFVVVAIGIPGEAEGSRDDIAITLRKRGAVYAGNTAATGRDADGIGDGAKVPSCARDSASGERGGMGVHFWKFGSKFFGGFPAFFPGAFDDCGKDGRVAVYTDGDFVVISIVGSVAGFPDCLDVVKWVGDVVAD